jgi:hypothetical protein
LKVGAIEVDADIKNEMHINIDYEFVIVEQIVLSKWDGGALSFMVLKGSN